jgi:hypothetical protein
VEHVQLVSSLYATAEAAFIRARNVGKSAEADALRTLALDAARVLYSFGDDLSWAVLADDEELASETIIHLFSLHFP